MAVTHTYTGTTGDITIDFTNQEINCESSIATLEIQELLDACREAEYSTTGMAYPKICNASGKEYLDVDNGVQVGVTFVLLDNWLVYSEKISGVFRVLGGNLVQVSGGDPFKENAALTYINILSAAGTIVTVSSGSGLSTAEHNQLMSLADENRTKELLYNRQNTIAGGKITGYLAGGDTQVEVAYDGSGIPESETIQ